MAKDYYEILETSKTATIDEIKRNYKKLAKKYHPDVNPNNKEAESKFKELSEAYAVLSDPEKRKEYNSIGHDAFTKGGNGYNFQNMNYEDMRNFNFGGASFQDLFDDLFGNIGGSSRKKRNTIKKGDDITYSIRISFADAVKGVTKEIDINRYIKCPACNGTGGKKATCIQCGGTGINNQSRGFFQTPCQSCGGSGEAYTNPCKTCHTRGLVNSSERIKVIIPKGVSTGSKIRIVGKGSESLGGAPNGDLYIITEVTPHPIYERKDSDLIISLNINAFEALLGSKIDVPTPYGIVTLSIPAGIQNGQKLRLKSKGMPILKSSGYGDLYIVINIIVPEIKNDTDRKKLEEIMNNISPIDRGKFLEQGKI